MKIITRYILREHIGPLLFSFLALTSIMLLNFISRQLSELVGKGLSWGIVGEFFLLAIPFTIALTIPMAVLVAVLYAFSRLASENEVTAMKASGVSPWSLVSPALMGGTVMSLLLLAFNDQILPRANHELKNLQEDISQAKPTFLLKDQVINTVVEGKFYLKAGKIDQRSSEMKEVVIYDLANPARRRTIYADSGKIAFAANRVDLDLRLFHGTMYEVATDKPEQLNRLFYVTDRIRIPDVGRAFKKTESDSNSKGDREMGVCEMQRRFWIAERNFVNAQADYDVARHARPASAAPVSIINISEPKGLGWAYCHVLERTMAVKEAHAAEVGLRSQQDTVKPKPDTVKPVTAPVGAPVVAPVAAPAVPPAGAPAAASPAPQAAPISASQSSDSTQEQIAARAAAELMRSGNTTVAPPVPKIPEEVGFNSRTMETKIHLDFAKRSRDRYDIEIQKKFSLAAACLIFCILGPPIALRFPRGGVGLVIGVSLVVFALYYVGLIGGEAAANNGYVSPFWAMWGTNVILTAVGLFMLLRIGRDSGSARGGGLREWLDTRKVLRDTRRAAQAAGRAV